MEAGIGAGWSSEITTSAPTESRAWLARVACTDATAVAPKIAKATGTVVTSSTTAPPATEWRSRDPATCATTPRDGRHGLGRRSSHRYPRSAATATAAVA